nr:MAG TPA: hypothetical protein [Caudoviricetes sp.]
MGINCCIIVCYCLYYTYNVKFLFIYIIVGGWLWE